VRAADVHHDGDQPTADGGRLTQIADPSQRDHDGVLDGVVDIRTVTEHAGRDSVQARAVALEQHAQVRRVAGLRGAGRAWRLLGRVMSSERGGSPAAAAAAAALRR
jgi:hypothetical protein